MIEPLASFIEWAQIVAENLTVMVPPDRTVYAEFTIRYTRIAPHDSPKFLVTVQRFSSHGPLR